MSRLWAKLMHPKTIFNFFIMLLLAGLLAGCAPAADSDFVRQPYTIYLDGWSEDKPIDELIPLDPATLEDRLEGRATALRLYSTAGNIGVDVEYPAGRASLDPADQWIVVYDLASGSERNRFHPPAAGLASALSADGSRLLLQTDANPYSPSPYPPAVDWTIVATGSGEPLAHIEDTENACYRQSALFDPAGQRIICVVDPALAAADGPVALQIIAYDVDRGEKVAEIQLPEISIGGTRVEDEGRVLETLLEPALALSPDGRRLAVVHAAEERVTLLNARTLTVERNISLSAALNWWEFFGFVPQPALAKGEVEGMIRQAVFSADGQGLYVFTQKIGFQAEEAAQDRGLTLVDLAQEKIVAAALPDYQVQWVRPAPDGTIFVFGTAEEGLLPYEIRSTSPSMLWRLDGQTLEVLGARPFTGFRHAVLIVEAVAVRPASESASVLAAGCPVTPPPYSPFIPPAPWPALPPDPAQFWYGDEGLWTALPIDGSWPQLAHGEKFWWWSAQFDVSHDSTPDLKLTANRIDGKTAPFQVTEATNGYHESFNWAMLSGVELTMPGCWAFRGEYNGHTLSFVVWVPPQ